MRVLFDTNVLLDSLLDRRPFSAVAVRLMARVEQRQMAGMVGATAVTTVHYVLGKQIGRDAALTAVRRLLTLFEVAPVDDRVLGLATDLAFRDFEDAVLHEAARLAGAGAIVTRNLDDFEGSKLPVYSPVELEAALAG